MSGAGICGTAAERIALLARLEAAGIKPCMTFEHIEEITLALGGHNSPAEGHCLLEVVSMFAGEDFDDNPACVDPVLARFGRGWNDSLPQDERQALKRYIPMLPGTNRGQALSDQRMWMCVDWLVRTYVPTWLELVPGLAEHAAPLRALAPITGERELALASPAIDKARRAANAVWATVGATVRATVGATVRDTVWATVRATVAPTRSKLQASAHDLYTDMINAELRELGAADGGE